MKAFYMRAALAAIAVGGVVWAAQAAPADDVKARQAVMKEMGSNVGAITKMLKGETPYDAAAAQKNADAIAAAAKKVPDAFKPNTGDAGPTEAKATIWSNWSGFAEKAAALDTEASKLADVAKKGDQAALAEQMKAVGGTCGACHRDFREKKS